MPPRNKSKPWFDTEEADRVCLFFERVLVHTEGIWAARPFYLTDWQAEEIIRELFGWKRWDPQWEMWVRKYSKGWVEVPRGNGKSEIATGIELELLLADGEFGAEVYAGAEDRDQASIVYRVAQNMIDLSPVLSKMKSRGDLKVIESKKRIIHRPSKSFLQTLPRDRMGVGSQGFKVHGAVIDEFHVQRTKAFKDAMAKGMGKRVQPLLVMITTAGDDPNSPAFEEHQYALRVLSGEVEDPSYFAYIKAAPSKADPFDEKVWHKANPALGDFLSLEALRQDAREAREKPSEYNYFLRYRLNLWVRQEERWMPMEPWDATASMVVEDRLAGRRCHGGLHLTAATDLVAWVLDFPDEEAGHDGLYRFWLPKARVRDLDRRTDNQASQWIREGAIKVTEGDVIDYEAIHSQIDKDATTFDLQDIGYHRWGVTELRQKLEDEDMTVVPVSHGIASMSPPTKEFEKLIYEKRYRHGGNPVMRWMMSSVGVKSDSDENIKIDPKASKDNVSGPIAAVMALDRALRSESGPGFITYEEGDEDLIEDEEENGG